MKPKLILCLALVLGGGLLGWFAAVCYYHDVQPSKVAPLATVKLKFVRVDSEETNSADDSGEKAVDGNPNTYWHTLWSGDSLGLPHEIIIELDPPCVIKGFTYLPRQDASDHGTIKDYEFYVSKDGKNFGQPVKRGAFESGKDEKIETFEPVKCRFIKLKAISEVNGLSWTSAAEIRVIQRSETPAVKDYWRGNIGQIPPQDGSAKSAAIDSFVAALSADGGLWLNGIDAMDASHAASPEEVVSETLRTAKFESGLMTSYQILDIRKIHIGELSSYTAALIDTNLGQMIVIMQRTEEKDTTPTHWWRRIYDAHPPIHRIC